MPTEEDKRRWIETDREFFLDEVNWPGPCCMVKAHPWDEEERYGVLLSFPGGDENLKMPRYQVILLENGRMTQKIEPFEDVDSLVERWAVD